MDKKENLRNQVQKLCDVLNKNNFKDGNFEWRVGVDPKSAFGGGICYDKKAFHFLKSNGHLDKNVCWKCGEEPISKEFSFTDGADTSVKYNICSSCFGIGKNVQKSIEGKGSSNCYIATVCYNDINAQEVEILRNYRDQKLSSSFLGLKFIKFYYTFSPSVAKYLANKRILNNIVRQVFLDPIVRFIKPKLK